MNGPTGATGARQAPHLPESSVEFDSRIAVVTEWLVERSRRHARAVVMAALALTLLFGWFMATHLGMDTDTEHLLDPNLPWRKAEAEIEKLFPQNEGILLIVVDGATPELADDAAGRLAQELSDRPDLFQSVRRPEASDFFRRNGLLFLETDEVQRLTDDLAAAQPLIAALAADPSINGLFGALNLALEGAATGAIDPAELDRPFGAIADSLETAGQGPPLSWSKLLTSREPTRQELQRFILAKPVLDYSRLSPGAAATSVVRAAVQNLHLTADHGVHVRLSGAVALNDEEFASVAKGTGYAVVISFAIVLVLLFLALRSFRPIFAIVLTLLIGLVWTLAFAAMAVGKLNLISVAFAVMFIGIAVDFGIQVCVRYREERHHHFDLVTALRRTGRGIGGPLFLAAVTTAVGFLAFVPTAYRGVSELGIIAGAGMLIAFLLNLTLLPALLMILQPVEEEEPIGYRWAAGLDRFLVTNRRAVMTVAALLAVGAAAMVPFQRFDFNPMNLRDPRAESVATLHELMANEATTPNTLEILAPSPEAANDVMARLGAVPEVRQTVSLASFVPADQEAKLAMVGDAALFLLPSLTPAATAPKPDSAATLNTVGETIQRLEGLKSGSAAGQRLAAALRKLSAQGPVGVAQMEEALLPGLTAQLESLRLALSAGPVTIDTLPPDLTRDWAAPDGRIRVEVYPRGDSNDNDILIKFVAAVQTIEPNITGTALALQRSGEAVWSAFQVAGLFALSSVVLLLVIVLRRARDVLLVVAPLIFAALMTAGTAILLGLSVNFANVIALPLLFGVGVAFSIYFVMNWRAGRPNPLQSSTARAVVFSGLTTLSAFSSLSLSGHLGTAAMGWLLSIGLVHTLLASLLLLPALMGPPPAAR